MEGVYISRITRQIVSLAFFSSIIMFTSTAIASDHSMEVRSVHTQNKIVALTFDDGPSPVYTPEILDILDKHQIKATFFVIGVVAKSHPQVLRETIKRGHEIGNHSMYHDKISHKSVEAIYADLSNVDKIIHAQGYTGPIFFRSPFGLTSDSLRTTLSKMHKTNFLFDFLSQDWDNIPADLIYNRIIEKARPGFIIVLHDGGNHRENTVKATDRIIATLKEKGYQFVTASELLEHGTANHK